MKKTPKHVPVAGDRYVPWLCNLPREWTFLPLKYLCRINARTLGEETNPSRPIRYIDISSVNSDGVVVDATEMLFADAPSRARRVLAAGDVFVSTVRTYLTAIAFCAPTIEGCICSTGFAVLTPGPAAHPKFLYYWTKVSDVVGEIVARSTGVSYPAINASEIGNLPFPIIALDWQQAIADFLDRKTAQIDKLIDKKQRMIGLLHEKRQALISEVVTKGLDLGVPMKNTGIPGLKQIPSCWTEIQLRHLIEGGPKNGISPPPAKEGEGVPSFSIAALRNGKVNIPQHVKYIAFDAASASPYRVAIGDLLVMRGNANLDLVGTCGIVSEFPEGCTYPDILMRLKPNRRVYRDFLVAALNSRYCRWQVETAAKTSNGTYKISGEDLTELCLALPLRQEQEEICRAIDAALQGVDTLTEKCRAQIDKLREYRQTLISAAVTGKIDVTKEVRS